VHAPRRRGRGLRLHRVGDRLHRRVPPDVVSVNHTVPTCAVWIAPISSGPSRLPARPTANSWPTCWGRVSAAATDAAHAPVAIVVDVPAPVLDDVFAGTDDGGGADELDDPHAAVTTATNATTATTARPRRGVGIRVRTLFHDFDDAHHAVVLVIEDVAMEHVYRRST
jgi:hypothetical protein